MKNVLLLFSMILVLSCTNEENQQKIDSEEYNNSFNVSYPNFKTGNRAYDIAYRIAVGDLFSNIQLHKSELTGEEHPVIIAGIDYYRPWVRDAAINSWNGGSFIIPEIAENTLFAVVKKQDNGKYKIVGQYWDAIIWVTGAWNHYLVTGDKEFLKLAYQISKDEITFLEKREFNAEYNLFRGLGWSDGVAEYPAKYAKVNGHSDAFKWPDFNEDKAYKTGHGIPMMSTYANTLYYNAYSVIASMAKELGENDDINSSVKANSLKDAINKHLWNEKAGQYYLYIDEEGPSKIEEALANSYAIMFGITSDEQAEKIFANQHISAAGVTCGWPELPRFKELNKDGMTFGRHNVTVWPHIQGMWADACALHKKSDKFFFEFKILTANAVRDMQFSEMYHPVTGQRYGGMQVWADEIVEWQSTRRQTWAATAYTRMVYNGIFGIRLGEKGITFSPMLPNDLKDIELKDLKYRNMMINVSVKGKGSNIKSFKINGKTIDKPFLSNELSGVQNVEILIN